MKALKCFDSVYYEFECINYISFAGEIQEKKRETKVFLHER